MSNAIETEEIGIALRSRSEELDAAVTHGVGAFLAAIGGIYLVDQAMRYADKWCVLGCAFYAFSLFGVLFCSTLSHLYLPERLNRRFRAYDQGFIFLLAAGSLSPFALTFLRQQPIWMLFFSISVLLAVAGFVSKVVFTHRVEKISLIFCMAIGWGQAFAVIPLMDVLPLQAFLWIAAGAIFYAVGIVFFVLDIRRYRFHTIWHLLVLAACCCHYFTIYKYVVHQS